MSPSKCQKGDRVWCYICGRESLLKYIGTHFTRWGHLSATPHCTYCYEDGKYSSSVSITPQDKITKYLLKNKEIIIP